MGDGKQDIFCFTMKKAKYRYLYAKTYAEVKSKLINEQTQTVKSIMLTREEILYWFYKFRKLNPKKLDHRRTLINNFVNSVFLFEDRMVITFNFKDGTETITFADLEKSALGSDLKVSGAPKIHCNFDRITVDFFCFAAVIKCQTFD